MSDLRAFKDTHTKRQKIDNGERHVESFSFIANGTYNEYKGNGELDLLLPQLTYASPSFKSHLSLYKSEFYTKALLKTVPFTCGRPKLVKLEIVLQGLGDFRFT